MMQVGLQHVVAGPAVIAYAPHYTEPGGPWLFELDPVAGGVVAFVPRAEFGPVTCRRQDCVRRAHVSLASACAAYGLDPARALDLRWWTGCAIDRVAALEATRVAPWARVVRDGDVLRVVARA